MAIVLTVISSPIFTLVNPLALAKTDSEASSSPLPTVSTIPTAPSTIGQAGKDGDFTTQALSSLTARPTNNIVNTNSFYDIVFVTATSGAIKRIQVTFPAFTTVPTSASFNEAEGIGPGTVSKSGQTLTYTVTNAVNVPTGTKIRLEFANINNPLSPSANYKVTVTTRNAANTVIDGPTQSAVYTIKQIGISDIADNAVTAPKIADNAVTTEKIDLSSGPIAFSTSTQTVSLMNPIDPTATVIRVAGSGAGITTFTENGILDGVDGQYLILFGISDTHQIRINNGANIILPNDNPSIIICCHGGYEFVFDAAVSSWRYTGADFFD